MKHDYDPFLEECLEEFNKEQKDIQVTMIKRPTGKVLTLSIWLCQGLFNKNTESYDTEYHLTLEEIDGLIEKLRSVQRLSKEHDRSKES